VSTRNVDLAHIVSGCLLTASLIVLGGCSRPSGAVVPGIGSPIQLTAVDGRPLPVVLTSTASDSTVVTGGSAVMGEAIATGPYTLSLRRMTGTAVEISSVSGTTNLVANGSTVPATIDLGVTLGKHVYTFGF